MDRRFKAGRLLLKGDCSGFKNDACHACRFQGEDRALVLARAVSNRTGRAKEQVRAMFCEIKRGQGARATDERAVGRRSTLAGPGWA